MSMRPERFAMEHQFDEQIVIDCYLSVLERVCSKIGRSGI
jgi:hypothetical protein